MAKGKVDTENRGFKQEQLEKKGKDFMASSLAVDESSDIRGDSSLNVTEEFLALRPVHGTTTGQDLYEECQDVEMRWSCLGKNWWVGQQTAQLPCVDTGVDWWPRYGRRCRRKTLRLN
ncbi:hypothetical protein D4764_0125980 [Takifugu flavidus]|uniref:Uncharacterized protein n=1 Tax=Takifugu flavidus TaxID=433684 RepID=A0A5C6MFF9_9TELE|nr:hypothetical protein D4764_0125980 [Takifugu flavidus]